MAKATQGTWFDAQAADDACTFFSRYLTHTKGELAGRPFVLADWQREQIIRPLIGSKRGTARQYRTAYIELPRKNGKSSIAAGVALYLLFADREPGAEIYSAAADRDQAAIVFDAAKEMIQASRVLSSRCEIYKRSIVIQSTGSVYRVLSADAITKHGLNAHGIIFDELHAQPNRELWDVLTTSVGARRQPLTFAITTAGWDRHTICYELHEYASKVRDGVIVDPTFLPLIYAAGQDDDWTKETVWQKANPNYGISIKPEYFEQKVAEAIESPARENTFRQLHLNQWTEQATRWLSLAKWDACGAEVDAEALAGRECFGGLDLASTTDLAALTLLFPRSASSGSAGYDLVPIYWVPQEGAKQRERRDRVPYTQWIRQGLIRATPGEVIDYDRIRADILAIAEKYHLRDLAVDRWNATQLITQLLGDGLSVVGFGQGFASMTAPTKELEALVLAGRLAHAGNPVMRWMASNVSVETDAAGNMKPSKKRSPERIDGIVATVMALGRAMVAEQTSSPTVSWV